MASAPLGMFASLRQLGGDLFIGLQRGIRAMPGMTTGMDRGVAGSRQRRVDSPPLGGRRAVIDGGADQGMPKQDLPPDDEQPSRFRGGDRVLLESELPRGSPDHRGIAR